jgi:hypothetical protein
MPGDGGEDKNLKELTGAYGRGLCLRLINVK